MKQVQIRRKNPSTHLPENVVNESKIKLGSHFDGNDALRGLSSEQEKELLPQILGIDFDDRDFRKEVRNYWRNFSLEVPSGGVVLNIETDDKDRPINVEDYVTYQWVKKHKFVADSKKEMDGNPAKKFYIFDGQKEIERENAQVKAKMQAMRKFIKLSEHEKASRHALRMITKMNPDSLSKQQVENRLSKQVEENPALFLEVVEDKNLKTKANILEMVEKGVIRKVGNQFLYVDETIGNGISEVVDWINNPQNSAQVSQMKAQLNEKRKS